MLHDWGNDGGFVALKRAAEDREGCRHTERMSETCCTTEDYWLPPMTWVPAGDEPSFAGYKSVALST